MAYTNNYKITKMNVTLSEVRTEAFSIIKMLKEEKIDIQRATEIRNLLNTVIDTKKTEVELLKSLPVAIKEQISFMEYKAIAGINEAVEIADVPEKKK